VLRGKAMDVSTHAEDRDDGVHRGRDVPGASPDSRVDIVPRKRILHGLPNGSTLPTMVGAVIYV
jgi:hypothetical protein